VDLANDLVLAGLLTLASITGSMPFVAGLGNGGKRGGGMSVPIAAVMPAKAGIQHAQRCGDITGACVTGSSAFADDDT
jgi:hypothetical protein